MPSFALRVRGALLVGLEPEPQGGVYDAGMRNLVTLAFALPVSAAIAGAVAGWVSHVLEEPDLRLQAQAVRPQQGEIALLPLMDRIDRLVSQLELSRPASTEVATRRQLDVSPNIDLEPLEELIERIEKVERRLAEGISKTRSGVAPPVLAGRHRARDQQALERVRAAFEDDVEGKRVVSDYLLSSLEEILDEFGRPTEVWPSAGALTFYYDLGDDQLSFVFSSGYLTGIHD